MQMFFNSEVKNLITVEEAPADLNYRPKEVVEDKFGVIWQILNYEQA